MSAPTVTAKLESNLTVVQTQTGPYVSASDATFTVNGLNETVSLTGSTTPAVTKQASGKKTLSAGSGTIDLTAIVDDSTGQTIDGTGLKVQVLKLRGLATNANGILVAKGASNGHTLFGSAWSFTLLGGQSIGGNLDAAAPTIGSGNKTIDLTGTGSQVLEYEIAFG